MQVAIEVNNSTSDQSPTTTTEQTNSIQQTQSGESLGAPAQPTTPTSAAEQQQLMNLLRSESAGSSYDSTTSPPSVGHLFLQFSIGVLAVVAIIALAIFCQQQLDKFYDQNKNKRSASSSKRKK